MIRIQFSEQCIKNLDYERYHHPHPRVQRKMETLLLKSKGLQHKEICCIVGISKHTLCTYLQDYLEGGLEKLKEIKFHKQKSELMEHVSKIEEYFRQHPPSSINEAIAKIEKLTGIKRSPTQVRQFLKSIGMKFRKVGMIPAKVDSDKQDEFKKNELEPRLEESQEGKRAVFFVDAAHFVMAPFLGFLWSFTRLFVKAPSGRKRFNVLGAINAISHELVMVCNDSYINSGSFCELLWELYGLNLNVPITLVLDNARYQKNSLVQILAAHFNIELLYLPSYSPNLNLIERLWKFVKKQCLYSTYYPDFKSFKEAISGCLNHTHDLHKKALDSLLNLKFQSFKKVETVPA